MAAEAKLGARGQKIVHTIREVYQVAPAAEVGKRQKAHPTSRAELVTEWPSKGYES